MREAAGLQVAELGPTHPELANTLNNLGVACERAGNLDDAEAAYRRAYQIAIGALATDDPLVARSADNLRDFCEARGRPFDLPVPPAPPLTEPVTRPPEPAVRVASTPVRASYAIPVIAVLVAAVAMLWWFSRSTPRVEPSAATPRAESTAAQSAPAGALVETPAARPEPVAPVTAADDEETVATAAVCQTLSTSGAEWRCEPIGASVAAGRSLVFYTRVRSTRPITLEHLWFRGETVHQRVELSIAANPDAGYRTYSRTTVDSGEWRVQLRANDVVLHEASFRVQ